MTDPCRCWTPRSCSRALHLRFTNPHPEINVQEPLRILFVANTTRDPNKGASGCDIATIDALRELGHLVDEVWADDMPPRRIQHGNLHQLLELPGRFANAVAKKARSNQYDVIQVNECHAFKAALQHQKQQRPGIFVNRSHGWEPAGRKALSDWAAAMDLRPGWKKVATRVLSGALERHNRLVVKYSDGLVVCSEDDRNVILGSYKVDAGKILALAPGAPRDFLSTPIVCDNRSPFKILHVGQFHPAKAPVVVAEVINAALSAEVRASFTWVCDQVDHIRALSLIAPEVRSRVSMVGWMDRSCLRKVYDQHGLFLFPSYTEGFSLTFLEAMSRGLCVIASRINGMKQVIHDGQDGFLYDRGDVQGMSSRILALTQSAEMTRQIGNQARNIAERYTWNVTARELVEFYGRRINEKRMRIAPLTKTSPAVLF